MARGTAPRIAKAVEIVIVDDDAECPPLHPRTVFSQSLESAQIGASIVDMPTAGRDAPVYVAVFGEVREYRPRCLIRRRRWPASSTPVRRRRFTAGTS